MGREILTRFWLIHLATSMATSISAFPIRWEQVRVIPELISEQVLERLEIEVAWKFATQTDAMARRCLDIAQEVIKARPNQSVLRFLRRLGRCYVAGMLSECVILCRAVLENALSEKFEHSGVPLPANEQGKSEMRTRIEAARRFNWLSSDSCSDALTVWYRGNTAVHKDPEATRNVFETVKMAMWVLSELYGN